MPWAASTFLRLPVISRDVHKLRTFALDHGMTRFKKGAEKKDLWYHLVRSVDPSELRAILIPL